MKKLKDLHISIRVSEEDARRLERAAESNKLGVATYVRRAALLAADRDDPEVRRRRALAAIEAIEAGVSGEDTRRVRESVARGRRE